MREVAPGDVPASLSHVHHEVGAAANRLYVRLPAWRFRLVWITIAVVCALNGFIGLLYVALYYVGFTFRNGYMVEVIGMLPLQQVPILIASYAAISVFFWYHLLAMIITSVHHRHLAFPSTFRLKRRRHYGPGRWPQWLEAVWKATPSGEAFEAKFLLRELVEIALQTYQAYKCSTLISQTYINSFYVAMLVINCWAAPVIYITTHHKPAIQRLRYLMSDLVLDFASVLVIPAWTLYAMIFAAILENLQRRDQTESAFEQPYDDVFLINTIKAAQQICAMSWLDYASKMMAFFSMGSCLLHAEALLTRPKRAKAFIPSPALTFPSQSGPSPPPEEVMQPSNLGVAVHRSGNQLRMRMVYVACTIWGTLVLIAHLLAARSSEKASMIERLGCKSSSRPWLKDQFSCGVLEINCYRRGIDGTAAEIDEILRPLNPSALSSLIIAHCPQLSVPPRIQTFNNLIGLELANSTVTQWGADAALLHRKHPSLQFLTLVRINVTALPEALQSSQFPLKLRNVNVVATNLTTLPNDLHTKWQRILNVYVDRSHFSLVPSTLGHMKLDIISLLGNNIQEIPNGILSGNRYSVISIARNPIKKLPDTIGHVDALTMVIMDYTKIETLPAWLLDEGEVRAKTKASPITVSAGGSVFCDRRLSTGDNTALPGLKLSCRLKEDAEFEAYPFTFSQTNREP